MTDEPASGVSLQSLQSENERLRRAVDELSLLNRLATDIGQVPDSEQILKAVLKSALTGVKAEQGIISLVRRAPSSTQTVIREKMTSSTRPGFQLGDSLLGWMQLNRVTLQVNEPKDDERFQGEQWSGIRSLLSAPLMVKNELTGVLTVWNRKGGGCFSEDDKRLASILASQSAQALEARRLEAEERAREHELNLAGEIQRCLLPSEPPTIAEYDIAAASLPQQSVGGDFYDFVPIEGNRLAFFVGDVSGKRLPAALLMAYVQATIREELSRSLIGQSRDLLERGLAWTNRVLCRSTPLEKFATLFFGILDPEKHSLRFANAGHEMPFLFVRGQEFLRLSTGGPLLGMLEDAEFTEGEVDFGPGDQLVVFSDGITDAANPDDEFFEEHRVQAVVAENAGASAQTLVARCPR